MRQIEILQYTCPLCNAQLSCQAIDHFEDFSRTTFKCMGCMEEFFSQEKPHIADAGSAPYMDCMFCGQQCTYMSLKDDWTDYWKCLPCKVSYEESFHPDHKGLETSNMYTTLHGHLYVLRQWLWENRSRIEMLPEDLDDTVVIAREFPFLFPNMTPTNIQEKLLTYLVFS
jgi:hypothetical protein